MYMYMCIPGTTSAIYALENFNFSWVLLLSFKSFNLLQHTSTTGIESINLHDFFLI